MRLRILVAALVRRITLLDARPLALQVHRRPLQAGRLAGPRADVVLPAAIRVRRQVFDRFDLVEDADQLVGRERVRLRQLNRFALLADRPADLRAGVAPGEPPDKQRVAAERTQGRLAPPPRAEAL